MYTITPSSSCGCCCCYAACTAPAVSYCRCTFAALLLLSIL